MVLKLLKHILKIETAISALLVQGGRNFLGEFTARNLQSEFLPHNLALL